MGDNIGDTLDEIVPTLETGKDVYAGTLLMYMRMGFDTCVSGHNTVLGKDILDTVLKECK